jgi:hypothetical protein
MAEQATYTPEYFNQLEQYYQTYAPEQAPVDRGMLEGWYGQGTFQPGASISLPAAPVSESPSGSTAAAALAGLTGGSSSSDVMSSLNTITDPAQQLLALQNPVVQAALNFMPFGLGGAISGYTGANAANQVNQILGLYGGTPAEQVNPFASSVMGLFGITPDSVKAASITANQFNMGDNTIGALAGYMQAATDPVLGGIVNALAEQAGPSGLTPQEYGVIGQSIGQQIQETMTQNPSLSYEAAGALTASNLGIDAGYDVGSTYGPDNSDVGGGWSPAGDTSTSSDSGYSGGEGWSSSDYSGGWGGY